ncbi:hypothetical protein SAMN02745857_00869 [Andreprevotia lacus DSM 23236]|jgi:hypothetical protein|uniref:Uncharacterized protein n=1 Tax=Andreprevotia lacus DSM 23236 TaxID=1121001 RepID=A0A1W1X985_9NEIS|nr:hypothetical protein [Andreprevotia lacus]SMC20218.1 hypothetical protein SAMN02745857_00869 [Andreprevotia lacus DSM 23236]
MQFTLLPHDIDETRALIYRWEIHDAAGTLLGRYVGKAGRGSGRPRYNYRRNVRRLLAGIAYRPAKPDAYRKVHRALAQAHLHGHIITLAFLCNIAEGENINDVEQHYIRTLDCSGEADWQLNG